MLKRFRAILTGVVIMISEANSDRHPHTNRLIQEESPYLRQHAHNPIDWFPWSDEAFEKALKEDKPIFLSIGYSTCHWCHVMERESFENEEIAAYMNAHYVNIKVDREELPHIDRYYQDVYMLLNRRAGGWPLTIVLTPDRKPFYAATYLPPFNRYGRPGLLGMMQYLYETFRDKRENVCKSADSIVSAMQNLSLNKEQARAVELDAQKLIEAFVSGVESNYDKRYKGVGTAPKFPHASTLLTLLCIYRIDGEKRVLTLATDALEAMARGGICDQIEGGFYRYSVDERWMVPHFEKMLYTNAELIEAYSEAYALTKDALFARVVAETVENLDARFLKEGLYYSASDADSDGEEGKYFVFVYDEAKEALQKEGFSHKEAETILAWLHITREGNFEGKNNPYLSSDKSAAPKGFEKARAILKRLRGRVAYPFIDYKIQTSWNALLATGLFAAAKIDSRYGEKAAAIVDRILEKLYIEGTLYHQIVLPKQPKVHAYLEDYAFLTDALISAAHFRDNGAYLETALKLAEDALQKFYRKGIWYMSDDTFESEASLYDTAYRSALAVMLQSLLKLALLHEDQERYAQVQKMIADLGGELERNPHNVPFFAITALSEKIGWSVVKVPKERMEEGRKGIAKIASPFVLLKSYDGKAFLACAIDRCYAHGEKIEDIVEKIK